MNIRHALGFAATGCLSAASLVAVVGTPGVSPAQQIQVRFATPVSGSGPTTPAKPGSTEFKPDPQASPDPKSLDVPADVQQKANDLVRKLGSNVYKDRELASRELATMGRFALPALTEAVRTSEEPEVVERAEALLPKAQAIDMKARVACFLADADGKYEHTLPGWGKFKEVAGNSKASRELFAEALKNKVTHQMLLAAERNAEEASTVLSAYVSKLQGYYNRFGGNYEQPTTPKTADLLIALFLESCYSDKEVVITMPGWGWGGGQFFSVASSLYSSGDFSNALGKRGGKYNEPITKVLTRWMDTRETAGGTNQAWQFAQSLYGSKPALKYAVRFLASESNPQYQYNKQNVLQQFGQQGAKEYIPDVVKACFEDTFLIWSMNNGGSPNYDIQLRDYALAVVLQMTDQNPKDYGMDSTQPNSKAKNWNYTTFYFKDERDAAERGAASGPGMGRVIVRGGAVPAKKDDKKEEKKDEKKDDKAKKLTADDKRKVAFKKWGEWQAANFKDGKLVEQPKKEEPKKDEPKKDSKPTDAKKEDQVKKDAAAKLEAAKKAAEQAELKLKVEEAKRAADKKEEPKKEEPKK